MPPMLSVVGSSNKSFNSTQSMNTSFNDMSPVWGGARLGIAPTYSLISLRGYTICFNVSGIKV